MKPKDQLHYNWVIPVIADPPGKPANSEITNNSLRDYLNSHIDYAAYSLYQSKYHKNSAGIIMYELISEDENSTIDDEITGMHHKLRILKTTHNIHLRKAISKINEEILNRSVSTLKKPGDESPLPYVQKNSWAFLIRIDHNTRMTSRKWLYIVLDEGFHSLKDEASQESQMWSHTTPILFSEFFFGSHWRNWYLSLRDLVEGIIQNRSCGDSTATPLSPAHVKLYFDLTEWLRDGRCRITQEAWKGHHSVQYILQPEVEQKVGVFPWRSTRRIGSPSAYTDRFCLAYCLNVFESSPPQLEEESYWSRELERPLLEGLINQWLWVHIAARRNSTEDNWKKWLSDKSETIKFLIKKTEMELVSPPTTTFPLNVDIDHLWPRQDLLRRYLASLIETCIDPPSQCTSQFWIDLSLVALEVLYEIKRQNDNSCNHPSLPCDGNRLAEALIRIVSYFAHSIMCVPFYIPIEKTLFDLYDSEGVFYMLKPRYRTHLFHAIDVCMLGHWFIENVDMFKVVDYHAWYTAALTHDVGYLAESIDFAEGMLEKLYGGVFQNTRKFIGTAKEIAEIAVRKSKILKQFHFNSQKVVFEHGLASGLHVMEILSESGLNDGEWCTKTVRAIVNHNRTSPIIIVRDDPFSALLLLCDELQEWGRPEAEDRHLRRSIAASAVLGRSQLSWRNESFSLKIIVTETGNRIDIEFNFGINERKSITSHYIWVGKLQKLERLEWPEGVEVNVSILTKSKQKELSNFISEVSTNTELYGLRPMIESMRNDNDERLTFTEALDSGLFKIELIMRLHQICKSRHRLLPTNKQKVKEALQAYSQVLEKKN